MKHEVVNSIAFVQTALDVFSKNAYLPHHVISPKSTFSDKELFCPTQYIEYVVQNSFIWQAHQP
ncbi:MAG: hypothetical protein ONB13_00725 [candidate division KSB1 bacterium]|nr:hypothetical protein [candidate division KSB1 bacterium]MDZ7334020.1 hypothetical protein [candidate division KSB1 bacterium]MDZ7357455.1 hypothetical protein [candidate division KSB1 bacterium]MDZ7375115.1 hypothetical protein [candidate division KSB1 bacterium]MDZ7400005.1 hypothetical protein [candidate division KSB1 bacterium]